MYATEGFGEAAYPLGASPNTMFPPVPARLCRAGTGGKEFLGGVAPLQTSRCQVGMPEKGLHPSKPPAARRGCRKKRSGDKPGGCRAYLRIGMELIQKPLRRSTNDLRIRTKLLG